MTNPDVNDYQNDDEGDDDLADYSECVNTLGVDDEDDEEEDDD